MAAVSAEHVSTLIKVKLKCFQIAYERGPIAQLWTAYILEI